jgi:hypothetical protein
MPTERMGPPPGALPPMRMTASWSGSDRTYRIQVGGAKMRLNGKLPSNHHSDRRRQTLELRRKARLPVHPPSACSGLKALRNTSLAKAASRQAALAFRSLDPFRALREPDPRRRDEERPSRSEQRTLSKNQKQRLDRKSPIQVRILLPPPMSQRPDLIEVVDGVFFDSVVFASGGRRSLNPTRVSLRGSAIPERRALGEPMNCNSVLV